MKRSLFIPALAALALQASSQCSVFIPAEAIIIHSMEDAAITENNAIFWVCEGTHLLVEGNNNMIFAEGFATGTVIGNNNTIISKGGSYFLSGNNNILSTTEPLTVVETGENNEVNHCKEVHFDVTAFPLGGCAITTVATHVAQRTTRIYPNPVSNALFIELEPGNTVEHIRIWDLHGRLVMEHQGSFDGVLDIAVLPSGLFTLQLATDQGAVIQKIHKE